MDPPIVTIAQGKLIGTTSKDIDGKEFYLFKGIPYAKPPLGPLRFKAPLPPLPWKGVLDATKPGNCCFSVDVFKKEFVGSEDCLNLNIYTPTLPSSDEKLKPVMVWIHGGGFICGSNSSDLYGPEFLVTAKVVIVTINYRLGLLGFLSIDDPSLGVPGNAGFKDMVMALKWVKNNIQHFNGDPSNVTIFGESAGGVAAHLLMLSPMSQGLFHKVIAQSGCALNPWSRGKKCDEEMRKALGCDGKNNEELLHYLQNISVDLLLQKQAKIDYYVDPNKIYPYGLVIERIEAEQGEPPFMCLEPIDIIHSKKFKEVPFMIGYTNMEGLTVNTYNPKRVINMVTNFESNVPHFLGFQTGSTKSKKLGQQIKNLYYGTEEPNDHNRCKFYEMVTDNLFLYGIYVTIKHHISHSTTPVFFYRMSLKTSLSLLQSLMRMDTKTNLGAAHGDDVAYLFKNIFTPHLTPASQEYTYIKEFVKLWTNFAYYGNPSNGSVPKWERVTDREFYCFNLDKKFTSQIFHHQKLHFWDKMYLESPKGYKFSVLFSKI